MAAAGVRAGERAFAGGGLLCRAGLDTDVNVAARFVGVSFPAEVGERDRHVAGYDSRHNQLRHLVHVGGWRVCLCGDDALWAAGCQHAQFWRGDVGSSPVPPHYGS